MAERFAGEVDCDRARERMGDDERRRGEIIGLNIGADAALEIAVAGENRRGDNAIVVDGLRDFRRQGTRVADACRAAVADGLEAQREVFTHGFTPIPLAMALRARRPAPISTFGFEVFVQEVMAAITTSPCPRSKFFPSTGVRLAISPGFLYSVSSAALKPAPTDPSATRPSGRFGPAIDGTTVARSSNSVSVKTGSGVVLVRYNPCAFA